MLSTLLRTIPAISLDVMAADFRTSPQTLGEPDLDLSFRLRRLADSGRRRDGSFRRPAGVPEPVGGNHRRRAGRRGLPPGPESFLFGQFLLGVATSGMLMCPMTLAAKQMSAARFGLWSGIILSIGNIGMLLSASPLAFVVESMGLARRVLDLRGLRRRWWPLPCSRWFRSSRPRMPTALLRCRKWPKCCRIGLSRPLRGLIALSLVSLAASLVLRGLWGGPWLMEIKALQPHRGGQYAWPVHARADRRPAC